MPDKHKLYVILSSLLLLLAFGYLYRDVIVNLVNIWLDDGNYSHGFLVPIAAGYFVWLKREELSRTPIKPFWPAAILVVLCSLMLLAGQLAIHRFTQHASLFLMMFSLILLVFGKRWLRVLFVPLLFLAFMFPLPQFLRRSITAPLQLLSSYISVNFLHLLNYPIYREGNILHLADTQLSVAEACSGLRSIVALTFSSSVIGYMIFTKKWKTIIPFLFAFPVAVLLNWTRITGTVVLADQWGAEAALKFFHEFSGLIVILVSIVIITSFTLFIKKREMKADVKEEKKQVSQLAFRPVAVSVLCTAGAILIGVAIYAEIIFSSKPDAIDLKSVPKKIGDFNGKDLRIDPEITAFSHVTQDRSILYSNSNEPPINLYLGYYRMDRGLKGFFHGADVCLPGSGWKILQKSEIRLDSKGGNRKALLYLSQNGVEKELMITWIQNGERSEIGHRKMIFSVFWNAVTKFKYDDTTKVMVSTRLNSKESVESAKNRLFQFIKNFNAQVKLS
jgi:exosortase D (VPLPA-CTERM-specific)